MFFGLNGNMTPIQARTIQRQCGDAESGLPSLNRALEGDGEVIFRHACSMGLEGIVSKRRDSTYRSGRSKTWLKIKNPNSPAARRPVDVTR
jgi:ATP-dependent DNA ligase